MSGNWYGRTFYGVGVILVGIRSILLDERNVVVFGKIGKEADG